MIPLRIRIDAPAALGPHIVRVPADGDTDLETQTKLSSCHQDGFELSTFYGSLQVQGLRVAECRGDVLLVLPRQRTAHRLIRSASKHNTLLITEQCDQLCVMCSQPPKTQHQDMLGVFASAIQLAPVDAVIGLSGGEPLLHKRHLFELIGNALSRRSDLSFHVLTNAQHFEEDDIGFLRNFQSDSVVWGIPIYSDRADCHDRIVAKNGAWTRLLKSFDILARAGASIELRTVIMKPNAEDLPGLAAFSSTNLPFISHWCLMQMESIGYARKNWSELFYDTSQDFTWVATAVDIAKARGLLPQLFNFPLCTVPPKYRPFARKSISDWKQKYLEDCQSCSKRADCSGFFEWYDPQRGFKSVRPL